MAGRPTKYETRYAKMAGVATELGATRDDLARLFEVDVRSIDEWIARHAAFSQAIKTARVLADVAVERSLYQRAMGYTVKTQKGMQFEGKPVVVDHSEAYPPDVAAAIFWLKNRRPQEWRDKIDVQHSGAVDFASMLEAARKRKA